MKTVVSLQNNLISLLDSVFSGVNELFKSPIRDDGHQKWVDFVCTFAGQLVAATTMLATLKAEFIRLAATLPEYKIVIAMYGVGGITGAQLMAEIGDVRRFANRGALIAFAGVDPGVNESGKHSVQSVRTTKRGSPHLRKTLFQIVSTHLKPSPKDEPVYQFLDRKCAEGKPYLVYMTAAANKFLRIYHAKVREHLNGLDRVD